MENQLRALTHAISALVGNAPVETMVNVNEVIGNDEGKPK